METKQMTKQELKERYGTDRHSFPTFAEWKMQSRRVWAYEVKTAKNRREESKRKIQRLQQEIKELRLGLKTPLPKKPHTDKTTYNYAKTDAKNKAEDEGWTWVEPKEDDRKGGEQ